MIINRCSAVVFISIHLENRLFLSVLLLSFLRLGVSCEACQAKSTIAPIVMSIFNLKLFTFTCSLVELELEMVSFSYVSENWVKCCLKGFFGSKGEHVMY